MYVNESKDHRASAERFVEAVNSLLSYDKNIRVLGEMKPNEPMDHAYFPTALILALAPGTGDLPLPLAKPAVPERVNAWVCQGVTCLAPVDKLETLLGVLKSDNFR